MMEKMIEKDNYKYIAALAMGAIAGLVLGNYIWGKENSKVTLSKHVKTLGTVLEEIEGVNTDDAKDLKSRINNILTSIESSYGKPKE